MSTYRAMDEARHEMMHETKDETRHGARHGGMEALIGLRKYPFLDVGFDDDGGIVSFIQARSAPFYALKSSVRSTFRLRTCPLLRPSFQSLEAIQI